MKSTRRILAIAASVLIPIFGAAGPASASASVDVTDNTTQERRALTPFDHPVSLEDAATVESAYGREIIGYAVSSDSVVGDYWLNSAQTIEDYLREIEATIGTQPEVVGAYTMVPDNAAQRSAGAEAPLSTGLPEFQASPGELLRSPRLGSVGVVNAVNAEQRQSMLSAKVDEDGTWAPNSATIQIYELTSSTVQIVQSYGWYNSNPFNAPYLLQDGWGMEFQLDFETSMRALPAGYPIPPTYGYRPWCGWPDYKDWASVSNSEFNWYALVYVDGATLYTPADLGLYGDYNDLSDQCTRSTVGVGMAQPQIYPSANSAQFLDIYLFPDRGQDSTSVVSGNVQIVDRGACESAPAVPLTDCMGVLLQTYTGPGGGSRTVLNADRGWRGPDLCWMSDNFGLWDPFSYSCG